VTACDEINPVLKTTKKKKSPKRSFPFRTWTIFSLFAVICFHLEINAKKKNKLKERRGSRQL
jgi:hypothetical protein